MKKVIIMVFVMVLSLCILVCCTNSQNSNTQDGNILDSPLEDEDVSTTTIFDELEEISNEYNEVTDQQGMLVEL